MDWFNAVDIEYQRQYREANDLNWERFRAVYRADIAEFRGEVQASLAEIRKDMDVALAEIRKDLDVGLAGIRAEMATMRADMMKWMFVYWSGSMITIGGLMFALLRTR